MRAYFTGLIGLLFTVQACAFSLNDLSQNQAGTVSNQSLNKAPV